jgi:flavin-dependent dehydrogenase
LVDSKKFPRPKVCGGCLNRRALAVLDAAGLSHVGSEVDSPPHEFHWHVGTQQGRFNLPAMRVVERSAFDARLVNEAVASGVQFLDGVQATVAAENPGDGARRVLLNCGDAAAEAFAQVVICADGLARASLRHLPKFRAIVAVQSRIGIGAVVPLVSKSFQHTIKMVVGPSGYVGLAASGGQQLNVAAALDPHALKEQKVGELIGQMLKTAGTELDVDWSRVAWSGTPPLTSRPARVAAARLFVIGDASGYVEPFSGEGMATALSTGLAVAPLACEAVREWRSELISQWEAIHRELVVDAQSTCRQLARILRQPWTAAAALWICRAQPWVARRYIRKVS